MTEDMMKRELDGIKKSITGVEARLDRVETRLGGVETRLGGVEKDMTDVKGTVRRTAGQVAQLVGEMAEVKKLLTPETSIEQHFAKLDKHMDGFARAIDDTRYRYSVHADTLLEHDKRLRRLEAGP